MTTFRHLVGGLAAAGGPAQLLGRPWGAAVLQVLAFATIMATVQVGFCAAGKAYCLTQLTMAIYYAVAVIGVALVMGCAGQVSLGHGAFFAVGGYTSALLTTCDLSASAQTAWAGWLQWAHVLVVRPGLYGGQVMSVAPWAAFVGAMLLTVVVACIIGYPSLRLKGHYLAMATLGFGLIVHKIIVGTAALGAADGITGVPAWRLGAGLAVTGKAPDRVANYYLACGLVLVLLVVLGNLVRSRVGRALQAIHDRELAAAVMGVNTAVYKLKAFVFSALLAAMAGVFLTHYSGGIGPSEAGVLKSVRYVALAAAGGMANFWGVAVVSIVINYFSLRGWFGTYDQAVFGALLILIISLAPEGPLQPLGAWLRGLAGRWFAKREAAHGPA